VHASAHHSALEISRLRSLDYDILDVKSTHWHDDFSAYKNSVKDLEVMFQNVINTAFEGAPTTQAGVELLDAFTTLSYRDAIKRCVETKDCMLMKASECMLMACDCLPHQVRRDEGLHADDGL
jgi:hypothetical protein